MTAACCLQCNAIIGLYLHSSAAASRTTSILARSERLPGNGRRPRHPTPTYTINCLAYLARRWPAGSKGVACLTLTLTLTLRAAACSGYCWPEDLEVTEERGRFAGADPAAVSGRAKARGQNQCGSLGSGNHYVEVQVGQGALGSGGGGWG